MKRSLLLASCLTTILGLAAPVEAATAEYTEAQKLFAQKNFRAAAAKFEEAMRKAPGDADTIYFCAVASQMAGNRARARQLYDYLVSNFAGTRAATMASTAVQALGGTASTSASTSGSTSRTSASSSNAAREEEDDDDDDITKQRTRRPFHEEIAIKSPDEFRVKCERGPHGHVYVVGLVNGQPINFVLDTGASTTGVDAEHMAAIGFSRAAAGKKFGIGGIGDEKVKGWNQKVTLRIGSAYATEFPITVQDHEAPPLLGQDFLRYFDTEIDPNRGEVTFRKKGTGRRTTVQPRGTVDVPFTTGYQGHIFVTAEINNRPCKMMFDTGAGGITVGLKHLTQLGLEIPPGAAEGMSRGVAGSVRTWAFNVEKIKVGSIIKENVELHVLESDVPPLLGQGFFGDYQHKVDQTSKVIHFYPQR